jgi:hypothetical protein
MTVSPHDDPEELFPLERGPREAAKIYGSRLLLVLGFTLSASLVFGSLLFIAAVWPASAPGVYGVTCIILGALLNEVLRYVLRPFYRRLSGAVRALAEEGAHHASPHQSDSRWRQASSST